MAICKYIPQKLYGFALSKSGQEVFFHLGAFQPGDYGFDPPPPPILGERVLVTFTETTTGKSTLRANRVVRTQRPLPLKGTIESFDPTRGYGFIRGDDGIAYHLHRSEVMNGRLPLANQKVQFYAGTRQERPRACHVKVLN